MIVQGLINLLFTLAIVAAIGVFAWLASAVLRRGCVHARTQAEPHRDTKGGIYEPGAVVRLLKPFVYGAVGTPKQKTIPAGSVGMTVEASYSVNVKFEGRDTHFSILGFAGDLELVFPPYAPAPVSRPRWPKWAAHALVFLALLSRPL